VAVEGVGVKDNDGGGGCDVLGRRHHDVSPDDPRRPE